MAEKNLKPSWQVWRFDQIAENVGERAVPTPADSELYIGLEHMDTGSLRIRRWGSKTDLIGQKLKMRKGDILFARRNAYIKRVAIAPHDGLFSAHGMVLRAKSGVVHPEFLPFFMQSALFMDRAIQISVGSLSPTINWKTLAVQEFAMPPLEDQVRLVEFLLAAMDAAHAAEMITIRVGELRKSLINNHLGNRSNASAVDTPWGAVPSHWKYIPVGDVTTSSAYGPRFPSTLYSDKGNAKTIRTTDFCGVDGINLASAPAATLDQAMVEEHALCDGDFLLSRSGEYAGKTRVFFQRGGDRFIPAAFLIRYRLSQADLRPKYLQYICSSPIGQAVLSSLVQGSAQPNIAGSAFSALKIPVPPIEEQDHVIALIEDLSNANRAATERLTASRVLIDTMLAAMLEGHHVQ